jgi:HAD superfamily hydrolase (TIGR01549 family)
VKLKGLIFDLDGTIVDAPYDWPRIRAELDTGGQPILKHLQEVEEPERARKWAVLEGYERVATNSAVLMPGIPQLMDLISGCGVRTALVSNNSEKNVRFLLEKFRLSFDIVLSREDGMCKPSADPFLYVMSRWGMSGDECGVVGDALFDVQAADAAGIRRVLIVNTGRDRSRFEGTEAEVFDSIPALHVRLSELI